MDKKFQNVRGIDVPYLDSGGSGKPLIFAHGIGVPPQKYEILDMLDISERRIIAPEIYGRRCIKQSPGSVQGYSDLTSSFISALMLEEPFDMVGHSLGGIVSFAFARDSANSNHQLEKIIGINPGIPMRSVFRSAIRYLEVAAKHPNIIFEGGGTGAYLAGRPLNWIKTVRDVAKSDLAIFNIPQPERALFLYGEDDELLHLTEKMRKQIEGYGIRIEFLHGMTHKWPFHNPELAVRKITDFLDES